MMTVLASIWLQLHGEQEIALQTMIASLARAHGTVAFQPHLTVCGPQLNPAAWDAASDYVRRCEVLPLTARKKAIWHSASVPFRAVVIDVEDSAKIRTFREDLRRITGAAAPAPPHISLLYSLGSSTLRPMPSLGDDKLRAIAEDCASLIAAAEFVLDRPVIVAPDGNWTNVPSWKLVQTL